MNTDSHIIFDHVDFSYSNKNIYHDFNFEIKYPITGIIGINGAGKSTMIKLISGLLLPKKGRILVNGYNVKTERTKVLEQIGVLFENPVFPEWIKVLDYLVFVGQIRGLSRKAAYSQALFFLKRLRLEDRRNDYVDELSAGLKQRFGLAQAFMGLPKILLLDEPTANLDVRSRVEVLNLISELARKFKIKVIIYSHLLFELEKICDAIAILHKGEIKLHKPISEIIRSFKAKCYNITGNLKETEAALKTLEKLKEKNAIPAFETEKGIDTSLLSEKDLVTIKICFEQEINQRMLMKIYDEIPENALFIPERSPLEELFFKVTGTKIMS